MNTKSLLSSQYNNEPKKMNPALGILVSLCIGAIPVNIFPRGGFQPVDGLITLLIIYYIFSRSHLDNHVKKHTYLLLPFIIWVQLVIISYTFYYKEYKILIVAINILYAFCMLYAFSNMWLDVLSRQGYKYIYIGFIIATICTFTFKGYREWDEVRYSFSFNNPNQLSIYAMFIMSIVILLLNYKIEKKITNVYYYVIDIAMILLSHFFVFMAITRAAIAGMVFLDLCLLKNMLSRKLFLPVASTLVLGVVLLLFLNPSAIQERMETRGSNRFTSEALEHRIKSAILEPLRDLDGFKILYGTGQIPVFVGAGAGVYGVGSKASKEKGTVEVHNMFGNVLWSYGIIGLFLYAFWIAKTIWEVRIIPNSLFIWAAILTYSMGGVVIRARAYWLALGLMMALLSILRTEEKGNSVESLKPKEPQQLRLNA